MFDIFTKSVELLLKLIQAQHSDDDRRLRRKFGEDVAAAYFRLLEIIVTAKQIVQDLELFERRFREESGHYSFWLDPLRDHLTKQSVNLMRWNDALTNVRQHLNILSPELQARMDEFYSMKRNAIGDLARFFVSGEYPLVFEWLMRTQAGEFGEPTVELVVDSIGMESEWHQEMYQRVRTYLVESSPKKRIEQLEECASEIRAFLLAKFSLEEILWTVEHFDHDADRLAVPFGGELTLARIPMRTSMKTEQSLLRRIRRAVHHVVSGGAI